MLQVDSLTVAARGPSGALPLVRGVSLEVAAGEFVGLVGESGSGKTLTLRAILGLLPESRYDVGGSARFRGDELLSMSRQQLRRLRGEKLAMVPQDPMGSLDPVFTVRSQIEEVLSAHGLPTRGSGRDPAVELLRAVQVADPEERIEQYPYQFSGGMRQRVMVAMALACSPELLIADEPTTALDATTQASVLRIMRAALEERGMGLILVTHDLAIIAELVDRVYVMYAGEIVEQAATTQLFSDPRHPYSRGLISSIPSLSDDPDELVPISGSPPNLTSIPHGCAFAERCWLPRPVCSERPIPLAATAVDSQRSTRCLASQPGGWHTTEPLPRPLQLAKAGTSIQKDVIDD